jgi:hypothetical protein
MEARREVAQIHKHFDRYQTTVGEGIIYYRFDADTSEYDNVYDEGFRRYHRGIRIPILWVDQSEAVEDYSPEGRRPTERMRCAVSSRDMYEAGISVTEAHGNTLNDESPSEIWRRDRMHDLFYYNGRFWEVGGFQIRGRFQGQDTIIGIAGIETFLEDDMLLDYVPGGVGGIIESLVPPLTMSSYGMGPYGSGPYGGI